MNEVHVAFSGAGVMTEVLYVLYSQKRFSFLTHSANIGVTLALFVYKLSAENAKFNSYIIFQLHRRI